MFAPSRGRVLEQAPKIVSEDGLLMGKLVHLALPVRWSLVGQEGRGPTEVACTYDIHPRGARLVGARAVNVGDLLTVERGRNKALCQVTWAAERDSQLCGQFSVQCVEEGKTPWDDELQQLEEQYQPLILGQPKGFAADKAHENRRRRPRYTVEGKADVIDGSQCVPGEVEQLSEFGARINAKDLLHPGPNFRLTLNVFDVSVALKAKVRYLTDEVGMGVEFQEIRRGDRPLLEYVLSKLRRAKNRAIEDFVQVEVVSDQMVEAR
jgi:hypothetical protein